MRRVGAVAAHLPLVGGLALLCACASAGPGGARPFDFERDTFAFENELYWSYIFDPESGETHTTARDTPVEFGQRCVAMARAARQFFYGARFAPDEPPIADGEYRERVREVLALDPRIDAPATERVAIPGYPDFRAFSEAQDALLMAEAGGWLESYTQRGNWRMIYPFAPRQQRATADELLADLARNHPPIVRIVNFPKVDVNHTMLVFAAEESPTHVVFLAYDPNSAGGPARLVFDRATRSFEFPRTAYFAGGPVKVYEIYDGFLF